MIEWLDVLAQVPQSTVYINPYKLLAMLVLFTGWAFYAQWVDKDTVAVNTYRSVWNLVTMLAGAVAVALLLLPNFWAAIGAFIAVNGGAMLAYVLHRNSLVVEENKVGTPAHLQRLLQTGFRGGKPRTKQVEVKELVRLQDAKGQTIKIPEEQAERELYAFVQTLMYDALLRRASFIQVIPAGQVSKVRSIVDGVANEREPAPRAQGEAITAFFKKAAGLNLEERRKPQKGKMTAAVAQNRFPIQVSTNGSTAGENLSLRVIGDEARLKVGDLGLTKTQETAVRQIMDADRGLVVFSAMPGHGLTTTIYAFARSHDAFLQNIQMLENEHELEVENITQKTYEQSDQKPFSGELQRMTRTDPDVMFVPVVPDAASAAICCEAAAHKQNVYVGIRAADVFDALRRWMELVPDRALLSRSLSLVAHQCLVRKLCENCKAPYKPDPSTLKKLNMPADKVLFRPPEPQYDKNGAPILCQNCFGAGYVGRTAVFNLLFIDEELRNLIKNNGSLVDIKSAAIRKGGMNIQQHALEKVFSGVTSIEEVARATRPPQAAGAAAKPKAAPAPAPKPA